MVYPGGLHFAQHPCGTSLSQKGWVPLPVNSLKLVPVKKPKFHFFFLPPNTQNQLPVSSILFQVWKTEWAHCWHCLPPSSLLSKASLCCAALTSAFNPQSVFSTSSLLTTAPPTSLYQDVQMSNCGSPGSFRLTSTPAQPSAKLCPSVNSLGGEPDHFPGLQQHGAECSRMWWPSVRCRWALYPP